MKPNVVIITTDQQRYDTLGCNGNPWIRTPVLEDVYKRQVSGGSNGKCQS